MKHIILEKDGTPYLAIEKLPDGRFILIGSNASYTPDLEQDPGHAGEVFRIEVTPAEWESLVMRGVAVTDPMGMIQAQILAEALKEL